MSILGERMLMHWLTPITSSPCSRLVSYCVQSSWTQHLSSSPSGMVSKPTQLQSHITRLQVGPDSITTIPAMASSDPWSLSQDGDFLRYKGLLYVPDNQEIRLDILRSHHDHRLAGHPGITKTIKNIWRQFYWPRMVAFVTDYIHSCTVCSRSKSLHHKPYGPYRFLLIGE